MPDPLFFNKTSFTRPERSPSLLERITNPLLVFDVPGNMVRGALVSAATGRYRDPFSVFKDRVTEEELLKAFDLDTGLVSQIIAGVVTDPLMLVGGIGQLTRAGKIAKGITSTQSEIRTLKTFREAARLSGETSKVEEFSKDILHSISVLAERQRQTISGPLRSAITVKFPFVKKPIAELQLPQIIKDKLRIAEKIQVLPDARQITLTKQLDELGSKLSSAQTADNVTEVRVLSEQMDVIRVEQEALAGDLLTRFTSPKLALSIKKVLEKGSEVFRSGARNKEQRLIQQISKSRQNRLLHETLTGKTTLLFDDLDRLKDASGAYSLEIGVRLKSLADDAGKPIREFVDTNKDLVSNLYMEELLQKGEARIFSDPTINERSSKLFNEATTELKITHEKALQKADTLEKQTKVMDDFFDKTEKIRIDKHRRDLRIVEAEKILGTITPQEERFLNTYLSGLEKFAITARRLGINLPDLQTSHGFVAFAPRMISKEAKEIKRVNLVKYQNISNDAGIFLTGSHARKVLPEQDIKSINEFLRKKYDIKFDFYNQDIAELITNSRIEHIKAAERAMMTHVLANTFQTAKKQSATDVPMTKLFEAMNLSTGVAPKGFISRSIFDDATQFDLFLKDGLGEVANGFMRLLASTNKFFQIGLTSFFPAFHHRNALNNYVMAGLSGVPALKIPGLMHRMATLQRKAAQGTLNTSEQVLWNKMLEGVLRQGQFNEYRVAFRDNPGFNNSVESFINRPFSNEGKFIRTSLRSLGRKVTKKEGFLEAFENIIKQKAPGLATQRPLVSLSQKIPGTKVPLPIGRNYGMFLEDNARGLIYLNDIDNGATHLEALRKVNKFLFDPSELGVAEKKVLQKVILFYSWSRKNIPLMINHSIRHPRFASVMSKLTATEQDETPAFLRGAFAIPLGNNSFLGQFGLGIEDIKSFSVGDADPSTNPIASANELVRLSEKIVTRLAPAIKIPIELAFFGGNAFTRRKFGDQSIGKTFLDFLPTARFSNELKKLSDTESDISTKISNYLFGIKIFQADKASTRLTSFQRDLLRAGLARRLPLVILRKDVPEEKRKRLQKKMSKLLKDLRK